MKIYRIVDTDNFGGDYPDEKFVENLPCLSKEAIDKIADIVNKDIGPDSNRYYKVVELPYELQPGFEP